VRLVILSGLSGSGKSIALHMLEDLDYYCVDNLPVGLLRAFVDHTVADARTLYARTAVGVDARNHPDEIAEVPELVGGLRGRLECELIFLTADEDVASWARLEALTGALSIIEPTPAAVEKQADPFVVAL